MMHDFHVGQKVVCVNDDQDAFLVPINPNTHRYVDGLDGLTRGEIYTIAGFYISYGDCPCCTLAEITRRKPPNPIKKWDRGFALARFRPLEEKPDAIEVFRQIARDVTAGKVRKLVGV